MTTAKKNTKNPARDLGARVRALRESLGLSQVEFAARAEMDVASVSDLERGAFSARGPTLGRLYQVASALGVQPSQLLP